MKTAISLPDPIFEEAERVAARLGLSRSELYARAIARFVREQSGDAITEAINRVVRKMRPALDPMLARLQAASLATDEGGFENWLAFPRRGAEARRNVDDIRRGEVWWSIWPWSREAPNPGSGDPSS